MLGPITQTAIIPNGAAGISAAISLDQRQLVGMVLPGTWQSAALEFQWSPDGATFFELSDKTGATVSFSNTAMQAGKGKAVMFDATLLDLFRSVRHLKLRSGTAAAPVNQTADRTFILVLDRPRS